MVELWSIPRVERAAAAHLGGGRRPDRRPETCFTCKSAVWSVALTLTLPLPPSLPLPLPLPLPLALNPNPKQVGRAHADGRHARGGHLDAHRGLRPRTLGVPAGPG